jgi:hypothetical protein
VPTHNCSSAELSPAKKIESWGQALRKLVQELGHTHLMSSPYCHPRRRTKSQAAILRYCHPREGNPGVVPQSGIPSRALRYPLKPGPVRA